ncbi:hypothetical protein [Pseudomonas gingeri]|uniref:hypothetical protein n=1 Tax=Pseudomonas gingeri TaxID=117681 RepID=UPI0015A41D56|nr:hypothetical protein [Pseudomonas gingeri]NWA11570.1 hypothetical protein [Pseudomonas gingeri]
MANVHVKKSRIECSGKLKKEIQEKTDRHFALDDRARFFPGMGESNGGSLMLSASKQLFRVAGYAPWLFDVIVETTVLFFEEAILVIANKSADTRFIKRSRLNDTQKKQTTTQAVISLQRRAETCSIPRDPANAKMMAQYNLTLCQRQPSRYD